MSDENTAIIEKFSVLDSVPVGVCVLREDFVVLFWNSCLEEWTKISRSEILGVPLTDHFPHLTQTKYATRLQQIFAGGPPTIFSAQIHKYLIPAPWQNGEFRIQQATVTAIPAVEPLEASQLNPLSPQAESFYALMVIQDVSDLTERIQDYRTMRDQALEELKERQRVEEELRSSQHFIQQIADATPHLMYIYNVIENRNTYTNRQVTKILGYTSQEVLEMGTELFIKLLHPEDLPSLAVHLQRVAHTVDGEVLEFEYRMQHRSGEWCWLRSRDQVFERTPEGRVKQIFGTAQDITKYKQAEETLRQQQERERLMAGITQHIRRSLDLEEVLSTTVTEVRQFLQTDRVLIIRFSPCQENICAAPLVGSVTVESVASHCKPMMGSTLHHFCFDAIYVEPYRQGAIRPITDIHEADLPNCYVERLEEFDVKAYLVVPLLQGEELWGLLMAHQCHIPRQWMQLEIDLLSSLAAQLAIAIQQAELYQQLQIANQKLERLATCDELTQLANRRRFDEHLNQEWQRLAREQLPLSLILCDVDFFKIYNDTYGHPAGDYCLQQVAQAISRAAKRSCDLAARYGGEEFAIILPNTKLKGALRVAEELRLRIAALKIPHAGSSIKQYVTVSIGVASTIPSRDSHSADLIVAADRVLYQAKSLGRDRIQVYPSETGLVRANGPALRPVDFPRSNWSSPTSA